MAAHYKGCNVRDVARTIHALFQPAEYSLAESEQLFRQLLCSSDDARITGEADRAFASWEEVTLQIIEAIA